MIDSLFSSLENITVDSKESFKATTEMLSDIISDSTGHVLANGASSGGPSDYKIQFGTIKTDNYFLAIIDGVVSYLRFPGLIVCGISTVIYHFMQ